MPMYIHSSYMGSYFGVTPQLVKVLNSQKRILKMMAGANPRSTCMPMFGPVGILPLPSLHILCVCLFVRKNFSHFKMNATTPSFNFRDRFLRYCFTVHIKSNPMKSQPTIWHKLLLTIRSVSGYRIFKKTSKLSTGKYCNSSEYSCCIHAYCTSGRCLSVWGVLISYFLLLFIFYCGLI